MATEAALRGRTSDRSRKPLDSERACPLRITQEMLAEYEALQAQEKRRMQLRDKLKLAMEQHVEIEPGPLTAEIRVQINKTISFEKVCDAIGERNAEELRSQIEPTECRQLRVFRKQNPAGL